MPLWTPQQDHPGFIPGRVYGLFDGVATLGTAIPAVDVLYFFPFRLAFPINVLTLSARTVTGGAGSAIKMGIWGDSPVSHRPLGAPLIADNTGVATTASNTTITADITDTLLGPGWYWAGSKATGTLPVMAAITTSSPSFMRHAGLVSGSPVNVGISFADAYANAMPTLAEGASFSGITAAGIPLINLGL